MSNKYAYDYACEDEYFEREMTLLEAKETHLPLSDNFRHKSMPDDEIQPPHWNDVRFNYLPQNIDRRMFLHDTLPIFYNMEDDYMHGVGFQDEDMDYEMPDPYTAMHFKNKRSTVVMYMFGFVCAGLIVGYPTLGLKMPQKDNPIMYRKKFGTTSTVQQFQQLAMVEYGGALTGVKPPFDTNVMYSKKGFQMVGQGFRIDLESYKDLVC